MSSAEFLWTAIQNNNNNGTSHEPVKVKVTEETIQYGPLVKPIVSVEIVDTSKIPKSWSLQPIISMSLVDDSITTLDKFINEYVNASKNFRGGTFSRLPPSGGKRRSKKTKKSKRSKRKTQRRH
uniref:Uncharacterized protein n=1 Tax=viral metagenome TaxID=1070528 RepID=A0A6C0AQH3_9ZZZZ